MKIPLHDDLKVGIFGGTFNPIHLGHLRSAEEVRERFSLDRVYFVPAARPPHKSGGSLISATHRLRMVELAIANNPFFSVSAIEVERNGLSYSVDTIRHFLNNWQPAALFFIIGLDAFREIHTWKDYHVIPELCNLIITSRPGVSTPPLEQLLPVALQPVLWYDPATEMYRHSSGHHLILHEIQGLNISASQIREIARRGESIRYFVPSAVAAYITGHALYKTEEVLR